MNRRELIAGLAGAAAWPVVARGQQPPFPLIAYLEGTTTNETELAGFRQGLAETGFVEGRNVHIEYRWADGHFDRLRPLVTELIGHHPAAIVVSPLSAALAAKALTTTPIIFTSGNDPVDSGLVDSLNSPGGNVTGVNTQGYFLVPKRLQIVRELVPNAQTIAMLVNPDSQISTSRLADAAAAGGAKLRKIAPVIPARSQSALAMVAHRARAVALRTHHGVRAGSRDAGEPQRASTMLP
jgi:putative ABC transport system substrate-binding protein